jgi:hypothetical protein
LIRSRKFEGLIHPVDLISLCAAIKGVPFFDDDPRFVHGAGTYALMETARPFEEQQDHCGDKQAEQGVEQHKAPAIPRM